MKKIILLIFFLNFFLFRFNFAQAESSQRSAQSVINPKIEYVEGEVIVKFKQHESGLKQIKDDYCLIKKRELINYQVVLLKSDSESTQDLISKISKNTRIEFVQPNYLYHIKAQTTPWGITTNGVQADTAWNNNGITGSGETVAVIDTGVKYDHPDLSANAWNAPGGTCLVSSVAQVCPNHGWDFVSSGDIGDGENGRDNNPVDYHGHGTHVSGTVAATNNGIGVVGVAPGAKIMAIRVLDDNGYGDSLDIAAGIDFARENSADVINMSIGGYGYDPTENLAVSAAWDANVVVVSAAGNESETLLSYPAAFQKSIAVGAVQETVDDVNPSENMNTRLAYFSNYGFADLVAPGVNVMSTTRDGSYQSGWNGTSMASPHVAGVAALILEKHPAFTPAQVKQVLESTAIDLGRTGRDQYFGSGLVDANAATSALTSKVVLSANYTVDNTGIAPAAYYPAIPADGASAVPIRLTVADADGNLISGVNASITADKGMLNQNVVAITDGSGEVILTSDDSPGTATITANVEGYGSGTVEVDFANILLVSDSNEWNNANNFAWYWDTALSENGQKFIRWNTFWGSGLDSFPTTEYLNKFDLVIWYTGDYYVQNNAQTILADYLNSGGKLFISGPDQLYYISDPLHGGLANDILYSSYLKAQYVSDYPSNFSQIMGRNSLGDMAINLSEPYDYYINGFYPDNIFTLTGGEQIAEYNSGETAGILVNGHYRSIYLPFGLETVSTRAERQTLLTKILSFYLPISGISITNIDSTSALVSWNNSSIAVSYTLSYGTDTEATNLGTLLSSNNYLELTGLSPSTDYYVKVASNFEDGSQTDYSAISNFTTAGPAPINLSAAQQKVYSIKLQWEIPNDLPDSYSISYGTDDLAGNYGVLGTEDNFYKFYNLKSNKAYYFKVIAVKNGLSSSYSEIKKIRTKPAKIQKTRIIQYIGRIRFSWTDVRGTGLKYKIQLFDQYERKLKTYKTEKTHKFIYGLNNGQTYYLKVRAIHKKSNLSGKWSKLNKFAIIY